APGVAPPDTTRRVLSITGCEARDRSDRRRASPGGGLGSRGVRRALPAARLDGARVVPPPPRVGGERPDRGDVRPGVALAPELPRRGRRLGASLALRDRTQRRPRVRPPQ